MRILGALPARLGFASRTILHLFYGLLLFDKSMIASLSRYLLKFMRVSEAAHILFLGFTISEAMPSARNFKVQFIFKARLRGSITEIRKRSWYCITVALGPQVSHRQSRNSATFKE